MKAKSYYSIVPLNVGNFKALPKSTCMYRMYANVTYEAPCVMWYLQGSESNMIVDLGPPDPEWSLKHHSLEIIKGKGQNPREALHSIEVSPEDVQMVIMTHLHWDHASNNYLFPRARFIAQKKEYDYLVRPEPEVKVGYELDLALGTKYELVDGDSNVISGISVVLAPGHSAGMQCVVVETKAGKYVLGGDLVTLFKNWEASPHIPNGVYYDMNMMLESLAKIDKLHGIVLPGHDQEVFERQSIYP